MSGPVSLPPRGYWLNAAAFHGLFGSSSSGAKLCPSTPSGFGSPQTSASVG